MPNQGSCAFPALYDTGSKTRNSRCEPWFESNSSRSRRIHFRLSLYCRNLSQCIRATQNTKLNQTSRSVRSLEARIGDLSSRIESSQNTKHRVDESSPWGVVPASVRECFDTVPLGTHLRDNPAIETGFQRGTTNDLVSHRHDQGERVAS